MQQNLQEALEAHTKPKPQHTREQLLDGIRRMTDTKPYACEQDAWRHGLHKLITATFDLALAERYPRISRDILSLQRSITLKDHSLRNRTYDTVALRYPDFARIMFGANQWLYNGTAVGTYTEYGAKKQENIQYQLSADAPPLTQAAKQSAREAESYLYDIMSHALATPVLGDLLLRTTYDLDCTEENRKKKGEDELPLPTESAFNILWRPRPDQIKTVLEAPERDPALLIDYSSNLYLVATWDTQHELPYRHILREYALDCAEDAPELRAALEQNHEEPDEDLPF